MAVNTKILSNATRKLNKTVHEQQQNFDRI